MQPAGTFQIGADHPSLPGHFPGRPIVPGVVLLDHAFELILRMHPGAVLGLPSVKFTASVRPGEEVQVSCAEGSGRVAFTATVAGLDVLRGTVTIGVRP